MNDGFVRKTTTKTCLGTDRDVVTTMVLRPENPKPCIQSVATLEDPSKIKPGAKPKCLGAQCPYFNSCELSWALAVCPM